MKNPQNEDLLLWLDMEMTGLEVRQCRILEVAALVTDLKFNEISTYQTAVFQSPDILASMDDWNKTHHSQSGLLNLVPTGKTEPQVEEDLVKLLDTHFSREGEKPILAGNSIAQDRLFVEAYLPQFAKRLHYRMLDVSSWKIIFKNFYKMEYKKKGQHRALDDIRESVAELKYYLGFLKI